MLKMINKQQLKNLNDGKLLKLAKRVYQLFEEGLVSDVALHYIVNEVSKRHYGFEDVQEATWVREYLCFNNNELIKMVKIDTAMKFIKEGEVGNAIIPVVGIRSINNDDKGNLLFFA